MLSDLRSTNASNLNFCYLNINSVRNKFTDFQEIINRNKDVISLVETKIDASFPSVQFIFEGYHWLYRLDISSKSGGILLYVKSSIPPRRPSCENLCNSIQAVPFEINFKKEKRLVIPIYYLPLQNRKYFLHHLKKIIDFLADIYGNQSIMGNFNIEQSDPSLKAFSSSNNLLNLIKSNTCFKGKGSCIERFLINKR